MGKFLGIVFIAYWLIGFLFWFLSNNVLFQPPRLPSQAYPQMLSIPLADKQSLSAIYLPNPSARFTLLFSHGNAEDLATLMPYLTQFVARGFAVLAYDYPGYGQSSGQPNEANTYQAIRAAYQYLISEQNIKPQQVLLYGRSLGTGPTIQLATEVPCAGVILESPMVSAFRVMTVWPLFPFDKYRNLSKIPRITAPILLIHGTHDRVIPIWHGKKIFAAITSPKQAYWALGASHNNVQETDKANYWQAIDRFTASLH